jgi:hypothetical protein
MNELVRARVPANLPPPTRRHVVAGTREGVLARVRAYQKSGDLYSAGRMRLITEGRLAGSFQVELTLIDRPVPPPAPLWARVCRAVGWVLIGFASVVGALAWLVSSLSAVALAMFLGTILAAFVSVLWFRFGRRDRSVVVSQVVNVR